MAMLAMKSSHEILRIMLPLMHMYANFRGHRGILARTSRIRGVMMIGVHKVKSLINVLIPLLTISKAHNLHQFLL